MLFPTALIQQLHRRMHMIQQLKPAAKLMNMAMAQILAFLTLSTGLQLINATSPPPPPTPGNALSFSYYDGLCTSTGTQKFQNITDSVVAPIITADHTLAASLMRLAFHDCFVQGCDCSVALNSTPGNVAEKDAIPNLSLRGFQVIDLVKAALELVCPGVYSCADILQQVALSAQKYVDQPSPKVSWLLRYGRRDGLISNASEALQFIPRPTMNYTQLKANFAQQGLDENDLVSLSAAHTIGRAQCISFSQRLYNFYGNGSGTDPALNQTFAANLKAQCPPDQPNNLVNLDVVTPTTFDNQYYDNIWANQTLFSSDNALKSNPIAVLANQVSNAAFVLLNFPISFTKMSEVKVKLYPNGEIRTNCALRN